MKKILLFGIVAAMLLSLTACGNESDADDKDNMQSAEQSQSVSADNDGSDQSDNSSSMPKEIDGDEDDTPSPISKAADGQKDDKTTSDSKVNQMKDEKNAKELEPEANVDENIPPIPEPVDEDEIPPIPEPFDDGSTSHSESGSQKEEPEQQVLVP